MSLNERKEDGFSTVSGSNDDLYFEIKVSIPMNKPVLRTVYSYSSVLNHQN